MLQQAVRAVPSAASARSMGRWGRCAASVARHCCAADSARQLQRRGSCTHKRNSSSSTGSNKNHNNSHGHSHGHDHHGSTRSDDHDNDKTNHRSQVGAAVATSHGSSLPAASEKKIVVDLLKRHDYDSFLIGLCFPDNVRSAFFALRAFNIELARAQSNAGDNPLLAQIRLKFWFDTVDSLFSSEEQQQQEQQFVRTPVSQALAFAVRNNGLGKYWLERMLRTREADALRDNRAWATLEEVETFSEGVYSSMMYAVADLFNGGCDHTETALCHVGIAHGLMQMLLAIPGAIPAGGHLGLPAALFPNPLVEARNTAAKEDVVSAVHAVCLRIDDHLQEAKKSFSSVPKANRPLFLQVRSCLFPSFES
jgi:NADH dehydrogenase [ubiquinone] 1 alpha subcomplex assembly factor 6